MNFIDILLLIPLAYAAWKGFSKGFIIELFTLLAFFVGIYAGINFSDYASAKLTQEFELEGTYLPILAFTLTFIVVGAIVFFAGKAIEQVVRVTALTPMNKMAGLTFGTLKMVYILSILLVIIESYDEKKKWFESETKEASLLYTPVKAVSYYTVPGLKNSTIFIQNAFKEEADSTGLTVNQVLKAKEVADSLGLDAKDAHQIYRIHQKYVKE